MPSFRYGGTALLHELRWKIFRREKRRGQQKRRGDTVRWNRFAVGPEGDNEKVAALATTANDYKRFSMIIQTSWQPRLTASEPLRMLSMDAPSQSARVLSSYF